MKQKIKPEWLKTERLRIERWEDEGGQMAENQNPMHNWLSVPLMPMHTGNPSTSLQWNERFVIEPIQGRRSHGDFLNAVPADRKLRRKGKANG